MITHWMAATSLPNAAVMAGNAMLTEVSSGPAEIPRATTTRVSPGRAGRASFDRVAPAFRTPRLPPGSERRREERARTLYSFLKATKKSGPVPWHSPPSSHHDLARRARVSPIGAPAHARRARLRPPVHRPRGAGRGRRLRPDHRLHRVRRDGGFAARREPRPDHAAPAHAANRPSPHRPHGRRHHQGRRPVGTGQGPAAPVRAAHRVQHRRHPAGVRALPRLRRRRR